MNGETMTTEEELKAFLDKKDTMSEKVVQHLVSKYNCDDRLKLIEAVGRNRAVTEAVSLPYRLLRDKVSEISGVNVSFAELDWLCSWVLSSFANVEEEWHPAKKLYSIFDIEVSDEEANEILKFQMNRGKHD